MAAQRSKSKEKRLESKLADDVRELEKYINEFSMFLPLPICLLTPSKSIVEINSAFKILTGFNDFDLLGSNINILFKNKKKISSYFQILEKGREIKNKEMELFLKDGSVKFVNFSASPRKDEENNLVGYFVAMSNISELKKLQDNLEDKVRERTAEVKKEQDRIAAIISNLVDPVIVVDNERRLILANQSAKKILKIKFNDSTGIIIGKKGCRFTMNDFNEVIKAEFKSKEIEDKANSNLLVEEVVIYKKGKKIQPNPYLSGKMTIGDDSLAYKVITAPVLSNKKKNYGYMKIFYNLTREKIIDQMKSEFMSIAAHQLRTPLTAIKWSTKLVLNEEAGPVNSDQKKILEGAYISADRVISLVDSMLNVSRVEQGRFKYVFAPYCLKDILKICLDNVDNVIKLKKINLQLSISEDLPPLNIDKEKMVLSIQNILDNALKYTPEFGTIKIGLTQTDQRQVINIKDNGIGIPEQDHNKIFQKFSRGENVLRMHTDGSGLGLYLAKNIIEYHGGDINLISREGMGAEFVINLPIVVKKEI